MRARQHARPRVCVRPRGGVSKKPPRARAQLIELERSLGLASGDTPTSVILGRVAALTGLEASSDESSGGAARPVRGGGGARSDGGGGGSVATGGGGAAAAKAGDSGAAGEGSARR